MSIFIDKEFESLIPPLSEDEFKQLEENILRDGIRDPICLWKDAAGKDILIDGHNRFKISAQHGGIPFQTKYILFSDREVAKQWIILNQFGRRNLSAYDRSVLALKLKPMMAEEAKKRMLSGRANPSQKSGQGKTDKELAKLAGVSHDTIHKVETINKEGSDQIKQAVRSGEMSINQAYLDVKGFTDKSPKQLHKEFIGRVEKKREDYKEQKKNGIVSIKDANADKENAKILANELYSRCMKMGDAIGSVYLDHKEGTINLKELATTLSPEDLRSLRESLGEDRKRLLIIIAEVFG